MALVCFKRSVLSLALADLATRRLVAAGCRGAALRRLEAAGAARSAAATSGAAPAMACTKCTKGGRRESWELRPLQLGARVRAECTSSGTLQQLRTCAAAASAAAAATAGDAALLASRRPSTLALPPVGREACKVESSGGKRMAGGWAAVVPAALLVMAEGVARLIPIPSQ